MFDFYLGLPQCVLVQIYIKSHFLPELLHQVAVTRWPSFSTDRVDEVLSGTTVILQCHQVFHKTGHTSQTGFADLRISSRERSEETSIPQFSLSLSLSLSLPLPLSLSLFLSLSHSLTDYSQALALPLFSLTP